MKLVVLDGYALNPGDLGWDGLAAIGDLTVHERTPPELTLDRIGDAEAIFTNKTVLSREIILEAPRLRYIGVLATGMNVVDLEAAQERGIRVRNAVGYSTPSVAQKVMAYLLHFAHRVADHSAGVHSGKWTRSADFCYWDFPQVELVGKSMGIVGLGSIGGRVASLANAFGMEVMATTRNPDRTAPDGVRWADMEEVFTTADFISLHCPLTETTRHLVNAERLARCKPGAILINTGRGPLIDEEALGKALREGRIAGAALDVLGQEPPPADCPLLGAPNCIITPHIAWASQASRQRLMDITVANLREFISVEGNA